MSITLMLCDPYDPLKSLRLNLHSPAIPTCTLTHLSPYDSGVFSLGVPVDDLFFIGNQLVATSHTGKVGVWNAVTQHWQVWGHLYVCVSAFLYTDCLYLTTRCVCERMYVCFQLRHSDCTDKHWSCCEFTSFFVYVLLGSRCCSHNQLWHSGILPITGLQQWLYLLHRYTHIHTYTNTHMPLI